YGKVCVPSRPRTLDPSTATTRNAGQATVEAGTTICRLAPVRPVRPVGGGVRIARRSKCGSDVRCRSVLHHGIESIVDFSPVYRSPGAFDATHRVFRRPVLSELPAR